MVLRRFSRRAMALVGFAALLVALVIASPAPATAADDTPVASPYAAVSAYPGYAAPTPYPVIPGYAGPYGQPQSFYVSIYDPAPYRTAGCADGDNVCLATPREDR